MFQTLITIEQLQNQLDAPNLVLVDCRFSLADKEGGRKDYVAAHIPRAVYAHLDEDLSGEITPHKTGRHPLPSLEKMIRIFSKWGIDKYSQVVVYDQGPGGIAARLWWMLQYLGHENVAVLEGGWKAWTEASLPTSNEIVAAVQSNFKVQSQLGSAVDADFVESIRQRQDYRLIDSRASARYRGEVEPIDPIAGHIPGAVSAPFLDNLNAEGRFLPASKLKKKFEALLDKTPVENAIFYCGSGVTACHNLLALKHSGLGMAKLYVGSWSDWITDMERVIKKN